MLRLYRRHLRTCRHRKKGSTYPNTKCSCPNTKCSCPIWIDGELPGQPGRYRRSLKLRDWQRAIRKLATLESPDSIETKPIAEAIENWLEELEVGESSRRRYRRVLRRLKEFSLNSGYQAVDEVDSKVLRRFRASRKLAPTTSARELTILRQFLAYCVEERWAMQNWALKLKPPKNAKPAEVEPYTQEQVAHILHACDAFGQSAYERLRARAIILLMRQTGLRISDCALLKRDRIRDGKIQLFTQKTRGHILLPIPPELQAALGALPAPEDRHGTPRDCGYFFWNEVKSPRTLVSNIHRSLQAVFTKAGLWVPRNDPRHTLNAHAHRFRHTLATEVLTKGGTLTDVADILGISEHIAGKHYAKWTQARQERIFRLMEQIQRPAASEVKEGLVH